MQHNFKNTAKSSIFNPNSYETLSQYSLAGGGQANAFFNIQPEFQKKLIDGKSTINGLSLQAYQNQNFGECPYQSSHNKHRGGHNKHRNGNNQSHSGNNNQRYNINASLKSSVRDRAF